MFARQRLRRFGTGLLILLALWVPIVMAAPAASAHATLVSTTPANGELVITLPKQVTMTFGDSVAAGLATVRIFDPYGNQVPTDRPTNPDGRRDTIAVPMPTQIFVGTYTVSWRVVSSDSHPVFGAFTFNAGATSATGPARPPQIVDAANPGVDLLYGAARLIAYAALALLVGATVVLAAWWPGGARYPAMARLVWSAWAALLGATVAVLLLFGPEATAGPLSGIADSGLLSATLDTRMGVAVLLRVGLLAVAAPGLALLLSRRGVISSRERAWRMGGVLGGAVALAATWSIAGHSAVGVQPVLAVPVDIVHLVAMGVWLGGLATLCVVLLRTHEVAAMRAVVPAFSQAALVCVGLLVLTGLYQGWRQVGTLAALVTTAYGGLLLGKVALVTMLVGLGAVSRSWVRRHYGEAGSEVDADDVAVGADRDGVGVAVVGAAPAGGSVLVRRRTQHGPSRPEVLRFRRMVAAEAGLAVVVLGVTAVLVTTQPARTELIAAAAQQQAAQQRAEGAWAGPAAPTPTSTRINFDAGGPVGKGLVDVGVFPATVGSNEIHLSVLNPAGGLLDVPEVTAALSLPDKSLGPIPVRLEKLTGGHYTASMAIPMAGRWQLAISVRTSDIDQATVTTSVPVR